MKKNLFFSLLASLAMTSYSSALVYMESTDLATGFYRVFLNSGGGIIKMSNHTSIQSGDAGATPYIGTEYQNLNFIGTQGNASGNRFAAFLSNEGNFIGLNIATGVAKSYAATETSTGVSFSTISWLGSASLDLGTDIAAATSIGFYQNSDGSFNLVALGSGALTPLTRTETLSGKSFNDLDWVGFQGIRALMAPATNYYYGVYYDPSEASGAGAMVIVDLTSGSETVLGSSSVVMPSYPSLNGLSFADIPWLDVSSSAGTVALNAGSTEGAFYVVNVPEPKSGMLLAVASVIAILHRRRNSENQLVG